MSIFDDVSILRQITFKDGDIQLMGERMVVMPVSPISDYCIEINDSPNKVAELYNVTKSSSKINFVESVGKSFGFDFHSYFDWMTKTVIVSGWGIWKWELLDKEKNIGMITVTNSPIAKYSKGKVKSPVDHIIRGFMAAGASASLQTDVDVFEEECFALGAEQCKFIFKPADQFEATPEVIRQIGNRT